jgi:hypothetical protein
MVVGVGVGTAVAVGTGVAVGAIAVGVGVGTAVAVGTGVGVDGTAVGVGIGVGVGVGTAVGVGVGVGVGGVSTYRERVALRLSTLTYSVLLPDPIDGIETVSVKFPPNPVQTQDDGFTDIPPIVISSTHWYTGYPLPVISIMPPGYP